MEKMTLRIVPVSALRDNYIWALCSGTYCWLVDPGEAAPAEAFLAREGLILGGILLTHRHADHQGGVAELLTTRSCPVLGPISPAIPAVTCPLRGGEKIELAGLPGLATIFATPGHTEEHIAYLWQGALFCGDTLFAGGCGRLLGGTAPQLHASLQMLANLPGDTRICCAHEYTLSNLAFAAAVEPANLAIARRRAHCETLRSEAHPTVPSHLRDELETNPFLRCDQPAVRQAVEARVGHSLEEPLEVFTALRGWKDSF
ncbi:hydroxyacylglutathione hydrolase [Uliginosibacterium sp. 31-12]|uniref:hydroxyacylglutathione hydrolase n=1 Tax=Uliginosibacterium sp. 31-12 TaxID=3062781 RepID=UPI0026E35FEE|nr:hydroxyacylglutathione hydrolase [Uliginosibacterium sp. 31-12]MDO6385550.1 hydroxyacylglutathione hydrolase [Uliginosibacterium sp. 31-12]